MQHSARNVTRSELDVITIVVQYVDIVQQDVACVANQAGVQLFETSYRLKHSLGCIRRVGQTMKEDKDMRDGEMAPLHRLSWYDPLS